MPETDRMNCPDCGAEMNHHADKLVYDSAPDGGDASETDAGGFILEAHACPDCGHSATRTAAAAHDS
ncbi:MAG TPA: hypothetical protein VM936_06740 [Pyrinomonadaceae bacterium]|jgi:ribosomal protein S27AE|nr:hypothetical protein [Pyrinomonadaceae bacterium]